MFGRFGLAVAAGVEACQVYSLDPGHGHRPTTDEVERFIKLMTAVGLVEVSRTGVAAMARGAEGIL